MDHNIINNLNIVKNEVNSMNSNVKIVAVTKTFQVNKFNILLNSGHIHFGENKVQEAVEKWSDLKLKFSQKIQLNKGFKQPLTGKIVTLVLVTINYK